MGVLLDSSSPISQMIDRWWDLDVSGALISSLMVMALVAILAIVGLWVLMPIWRTVPWRFCSLA